TLTATLTPSGATGSVEFFDGASSLGSAPVAGGTASVATSSLTVGPHTLSAVYTPTGCYVGSTSPNVSHTVNKAQPAVAVTSDINPSTWNQAVTFTATLSAGTATGTVTFKDSLTTLAVVAVSGGTAQLVKSNLYTGNHTQITASYSGDGCFKTATSPPYSQLVYR